MGSIEGHQNDLIQRMDIKNQSTAMKMNHDLNMKIEGGKERRTRQNREKLSYMAFEAIKNKHLDEICQSVVNICTFAAQNL